MDCPNCGLTNPESAQRCDCGYDFSSGRVQHGQLLHGGQAKQGTFFGGFAAGFFGGCLGLALVYMIAKGDATKRGAVTGFVVGLVVGGVLRLLASNM